MRPRTLGKIVIAVLCVMSLLTALIYAIDSGEGEVYRIGRAVTYAIMSVTFAVAYRYVED
jgi:predicted Co/Zn/Cd cation transporter (cation efflux family)